MRTLCLTLCICLLSACAIHYQPRPISEPEAYAVVTQAVMQQQAAQRPASAYVDSRYLGVRMPEPAGSMSSTPQDITERIYFDSLEDIQLRRSGQGYLVRLQDAEGDTVREYRLDDRQQAERLVDALSFYRDNAPAAGGFE